MYYNFAQGGNLGTFDILFIMMFWTYPEKISLVPFFSGSNSNALGLYMSLDVLTVVLANEY